MESFFSAPSTSWSPALNMGTNNGDGTKTEVVDDPMKPKYFAIKKLTPDGPSPKTILKNMVTQFFNPVVPEPPRRSTKAPATRVSFNLPQTSQGTTSELKGKESSLSKGKDGEGGSDEVEDDMTEDETISSDESAEEAREEPTSGDSVKETTAPASPAAPNPSSSSPSATSLAPSENNGAPATQGQSRMRQRPADKYEEEEEEEEDPYAGNEIVVAMLKEALHIRRAKMAQESDPRITRNMHAIAVELKQMGRYDDAVSLLRDAADLVRKRCQGRLQERSRSIFFGDEEDDEEEGDLLIPHDDDAASSASNGVASFDIGAANDEDSGDEVHEEQKEERSHEKSIASAEQPTPIETMDERWTSALEDEDYVRDVDELSAILMTTGNIYRFREMWNDAARYYGDAVGVLRPCKRHCRKLKVAERILERIRSMRG